MDDLLEVEFQMKAGMDLLKELEEFYLPDSETEEFFYRLRIKDGLNLKSTVKFILEMLSGNILASGELDETSVDFSDRSTGGRKPKIYNLDMILSVGYRVNSKRGIAFRKWANNVLKQFILKDSWFLRKRER